jgi:hypothetical protein
MWPYNLRGSTTVGHTTDAIPDTPLHLTKFDGSYIRDFDEEMLMRAPNDSRQHTIIFQELEVGERGKADKSLCSA